MTEEVMVVLALSLAASAVYSVISLLSAPLAGATVSTTGQTTLLASQLADVAFSLAPVWLVSYLLRRSGEGTAVIGLDAASPRKDALLGAALALVVGAAGLGIYLISVEVGINRFVVPVPPLGHWWTVPILVLTAVAAGLLEEVVVLGYLITRLRHIGWGVPAAVAASALLRASYHLYQGWGAFIGNLAMGVLFGVLFIRWRRTWPFVIAHALIDIGAGIGYIALRQHLPGAA